MKAVLLSAQEPTLLYKRPAFCHNITKCGTREARYDS